MNGRRLADGGHAATLREEFDRSFANAAVSPEADSEEVLLVRVGGVSHAIRLAEIGGLFANRRVIALPSETPELLGLAGFRGQVAPVYDLAAILGHTRQAAPRLLLLPRGDDLAALAFDAVEGRVSAGAQELVAARAGGTAGDGRNGAHLNGAVRAAGAVHALIDLSSVMEAIRRRVQAPQSIRSP